MLSSLHRAVLGLVSVLVKTGTHAQICRYRCSKCDFRVLQFEDSTWDSTADYMFFRNYFPDCAKLLTKLKPINGMSALACQCSWANVEDGFFSKVPHVHWFVQ